MTGPKVDPTKGRESLFPFAATGLLVQPRPSFSGEVFYAEVEPAGSRLLPWPGRTSRWWFEIHALTEPDEHGVCVSTYAYNEGGSGGAFTFAKCVRKAQQAVEFFAEQADEQWRTENP